VNQLRNPAPRHRRWRPAAISVTGFVISRATTAELAAAARAINGRLSGGADFGLVAGDVLPLDQTALAHTRVESGEPGRSTIKIAD